MKTTVKLDKQTKIKQIKKNAEKEKNYSYTQKAMVENKNKQKTDKQIKIHKQDQVQ